MSARSFYLRLVILFVVATVVGLLVYLLLGAQGYRLYAWPAAVLVILPFLSSTLRERMRAVRMRPAHRFWLIVPLFLLAVLRIGYWLLFFSSSGNATMAHVVSTQIGFYAGRSLYAPHLVVVLIALYFLWRLRPRKQAA